jgi:hypothetical protein
VREYLLVLLEPSVHGLPLEVDVVAEVLDRRLGISHGGVAGLGATHAHGEVLGVAPTGGVAALAGGYQLGHHVVRGEVVGRVVRHLPDQQRAGGVGHEVAPEVGTDSLGAAFDPYTTSLGISHVRANRLGKRRIPLRVHRESSG